MELRVVSNGLGRRGKTAGLLTALAVSPCVATGRASAQTGRADVDTVRAGFESDLGRVRFEVYGRSIPSEGRSGCPVIGSFSRLPATQPNARMQ